ncbi:MAG: alpha/beta hydrolase-fold protein [Planctomycetota bacterium]
MRSPIYACFVIVLLGQSGLAAEEDGDQVRITFDMHSPNLSNDTAVFITGNITRLGSWRPDVVQMTWTENHTWALQLSVPRGVSIEYKFTLGDWFREAADDAGRPLENFELTAAESGTYKHQVNAWTNRKPRVVRGQVTGELRYHRQIKSEGLRPRDVVVWLPPSYEADEPRSYPVLYMHDGQNLFDPKTSAFGIDWQVDESVTELIQSNQLEPMIVVGIFNTPDRSQEYLSGDKGNRYRDFVASELKPFVDSEYRTKTEREHTFVGGSSAGGLCAFVMAWEHAGTFSGAVCMSPAFRFQREDGSIAIDYVKNVLSSPRTKPPLQIYIDNGGKGVDEQLMPGVNAMIKALLTKGFVQGEDLQVVIKPEDPHTESAWARRFPAAIKFLLD